MTISCYRGSGKSGRSRLESTGADWSRARRIANRRSRRAFTLIELLMVVMVITILYGILLSVIRTVQRHTLQTVTRGELKNIENAWKQYFAHYQMWPETAGHQIDKEVSEALQGITNSPWAANWNPDGIAFMEFSRFDADRRPLNAWGESGRHDKDMCSYYVLFDTDGDNRLLATDVGPLPNGLPVPFTNALFRGVAVWSYNPEERDDARKTLGSWQQ